MEQEIDIRQTGRAYRVLRDAAGMSMRTLVAEYGENKCNLSRFENGHFFPSWQTLCRQMHHVGGKVEIVISGQVLDGAAWMPGELVKRSRAAAGLSLKGLAEECGMIRGNILQTENGANQPTVRRLAWLLQCCHAEIRLRRGEQVFILRVPPEFGREKRPRKNESESEQENHPA